VPHLLAAVTGLAALLHASGVAFQALRYLGVFFLAFLPQLVPPSARRATWRMLALSGVFMAMTFVVFAGYGACAAALRDRVLAHPAVVDRVRKAFAVSFAALAAKLAVEPR
jgi:threonine/homoserine/homoserine lactone efflux protein